MLLQAGRVFQRRLAAIHCWLRHTVQRILWTETTRPKNKNRDQLWRLWGQGAGLSPHISVCVCACVSVVVSWLTSLLWLLLLLIACCPCLSPCHALSGRWCNGAENRRRLPHTKIQFVCAWCVCLVCVCNSHALNGQTGGWTDELERRAYADELTAFNYKQSKSEKQMKWNEIKWKCLFELELFMW